MNIGTSLSAERKSRELDAEYRRLVRSKAGPRDNGYTATFVERRDEFLEDMTPEVMELRAKVRALRARSSWI